MYVGFSTATTAMLGLKQTLMLHLPWHQQCFAAVWVGTVLDFLIGPHLLPWRLSAQIYWVFLGEKLPETWWQHNRAAAHFPYQVWEHLTTYNSWIGQGRPV